MSRLGGPRIALVSLYDVENNAVRLLAAVLRRAGAYVVEIYFKDWISNHLDPPSDVEIQNLLTVLRQEGIHLVSFSIRASAYCNMARILTEPVHRELDLAVLWGGMHATLEPEQCLRDADLVLRGEGEFALEELATRLTSGEPIQDIPNLGLMLEGTPRLNPLLPVIPDLDVLPFRDYTTHEQKYLIQGSRVREGDPMFGDPVFQMMASRGCIFQCSYCYNSTFKKSIYPGQKWFRVRSCDSVFAEIRQAREHWHFKRIRFDDEVFNFQPEWFDEFCRRYPVEVGIPFEIFIEPKLVTRDRMARLRDTGLTGVYMGIQSSERVTGHLYDRRVQNQTIEDIGKIFSDLGIYPHYQLIFDDPVSTEDDKRKLFDLVYSFPRPFDLYLFSLTVFPGSELNRKLMESGLISAYDIEGENTRTFYQHRVNLQYPRPVEDTFWISLTQLLSKDFIPKPAVRALTYSALLKRHPWPLIQLAHGANYIKLGSTAMQMVFRGEMTTTLVRRWLNFNRVITS